MGLETRWGRSFPTVPDRLRDTSFWYNGYRVTFRGVRLAGREFDHPPPSSTEFENEQSSTSASHLRLLCVKWCFQIRISEADVHFRTHSKVTCSISYEV